MSETEASNALRLKIRAPSHTKGQSDIGPVKALKTAIVRAAEIAAGLQVAVVGLDVKRSKLPEITETLDEPHLIFSTSGAAGVVGLAIWDIQLVAGFTEQLITGRILPTAAQSRVVTSTDAAVLGEVLVKILKSFAVELSKEMPGSSLAGFNKSGVIEDGRAVSLLLEDLTYQEYFVTLDLGDGAKKGVLRLIYPLDTGRQEGAGFTGANSWGQKWPRVICDAKAPIRAVLYRKPMILSDITKLEVGDLVEIPTEVIAGVSLEGSDNCQVASGRLGQQNNHRAVLITLANATGPPEQDIGAFQVAEPSTGVTETDNTIQLDPPVETPAPETGRAEISEDTDGLAVN